MYWCLVPWLRKGINGLVPGAMDEEEDTWFGTWCHG